MPSCERYSGLHSRYNTPVHVRRHTTTVLYAPILIHYIHNEQITQHVPKGAGSVLKMITGHATSIKQMRIFDNNDDNTNNTNGPNIVIIIIITTTKNVLLTRV